MLNKRILRIIMLLLGLYVFDGFADGSGDKVPNVPIKPNFREDVDPDLIEQNNEAPTEQKQNVETEAPVPPQPRDRSLKEILKGLPPQGRPIVPPKQPVSSSRSRSFASDPKLAKKSCIQIFQENRYTAKVSANGFYIADVKTTGKVGQLNVARTQYLACNSATNQVFTFDIKAKRDACSSSKTLVDQRKYCLTDQSVATPGAVVKPERQQLRARDADVIIVPLE